MSEKLPHIMVMRRRRRHGEVNMTPPSTLRSQTSTTLRSQTSTALRSQGVNRPEQPSQLASKVLATVERTSQLASKVLATVDRTSVGTYQHQPSQLVNCGSLSALSSLSVLPSLQCYIHTRSFYSLLQPTDDLPSSAVSHL